MKPVASIPSPRLSESQRAALLMLLTDDDPAVHATIRKKLIAEGPAVIDWLRPHTRSDDPALRRRAMDIVSHFDKQAADNTFLGFCLRNGEDFDLENSAWLLARTAYPNINVEGYRALLDCWAADLKERLDMTAPAKAMLQVFHSYLFDDLKFYGNEDDYYDPENSYVNRVIDRRTGNPINLCLVYMMLARRLRLPVAGIGLPGHFICRYQSSSAEVYVDVFHKGKFLSKADCVQYLLNASLNIREDYLAPVRPRRLMLRICANLHQIYIMRDLEGEATRMQRYVVALGR